MASTARGRDLLAKKMTDPNLIAKSATIPTWDNAVLIIREFHYPADYPAVIDLWKSAGAGVKLRRSDEPGELQKKLLRDPDLFLIAELDGKIVGSVLGGFDGRRGMMYHMAVNHADRNRGIGSLLVDELERRLLEKGCLRYYLLVFPDNPEAIRFYEAHGLKRMLLYAYGKDIA
jgi:ribosomal protein S18 acetylase RimI-like enzyme